MAFLKDVTTELKKLCNKKATGYLFIVSDENQQASFGLIDGRIVSIRFRGTYGIEVISKISAMQNGRFRFDPDSLLFRKTKLPSNDEIIKQVLGSHFAQPQKANDKPNNRELFNTPEKKAAVEDVLIDILGPIGGLLSDSVQDSRSIKEVIDILKEEQIDASLLTLITDKIKAIV